MVLTWERREKLYLILVYWSSLTFFFAEVGEYGKFSGWKVFLKTSIEYGLLLLFSFLIMHSLSLWNMYFNYFSLLGNYFYLTKTCMSHSFCLCNGVVNELLVTATHPRSFSCVVVWMKSVSSNWLNKHYDWV